MIDFLLHTRDMADALDHPAPSTTRSWSTLAGPGSAEAMDPKQFRQALGMFATGVTVVTTIAPDGSPRGLTANSFTSVSLTPPLVLVCIDRAAKSYTAFTQGNGFAINILSQDQRELSQRFASKTADKFAGVDWSKGANRGTHSRWCPCLVGMPPLAVGHRRRSYCAHRRSGRPRSQSWPAARLLWQCLWRRGRARCKRVYRWRERHGSDRDLAQ